MRSKLIKIGITIFAILCSHQITIILFVPGNVVSTHSFYVSQNKHKTKNKNKTKQSSQKIPHGLPVKLVAYVNRAYILTKPHRNQN